MLPLLWLILRIASASLYRSDQFPMVGLYYFTIITMKFIWYSSNYYGHLTKFIQPLAPQRTVKLQLTYYYWSFPLWLQKIAWMRAMVIRVYKICSKKSSLQAEAQQVQTFMSLNGFSWKFSWKLTNVFGTSSPLVSSNLTEPKMNYEIWN